MDSLFSLYAMRMSDCDNIADEADSDNEQELRRAAATLGLDYDDLTDYEKDYLLSRFM